MFSNGVECVRVTGLVEAIDHVCCRYRLRAFQAPLAERGNSLELLPLPRGLWQRWTIGRQLGHADAVVLQRKLLSGTETNLLRNRVRRLFFDFDDAVWLRDSYAVKGLQSRRRLHRFRTIIERCDAILAGNAFLADHAACWAKNCAIRVIPTCVDVHRYGLAKHERPAGEAHLVWIGSSSTLRGLEAITPMLERIGEENPNVSLKLVCDRFLTLRHLQSISRLWSEAGEAAEMASADIGVSWLPDDLWSRGKCGLKILQYMAAGLPVVANPVGVQNKMIRHGENGFLARTEQEWLQAIRTLAHEPELRQRMGQAGRRLVEELYSVEAGADHWNCLLGNSNKGRISA